MKSYVGEILAIGRYDPADMNNYILHERMNSRYIFLPRIYRNSHVLPRKHLYMLKMRDVFHQYLIRT